MAYDIQIARLKVVHELRYMRTMVLNAVLVPRPGLGTMAIDIHGRIYYDPAVLTEWSLKEGAGVVLHECLHWFLRHGYRAREFFGEHADANSMMLWNIAADMVVNQIVLEVSGLSLPEGCVDYKDYGFEPNLTLLEYYHLLLKKQEEEGGKGQGQGKEGDGAGHGSGSGSDGQAREYEMGGPDGTDANYGHDKASTDRIVRVTAKDMADSAKAGKIGSYLQRAVDAILKPKWNPRQLLWKRMRNAVTRTQGYSDYTWAKPSRNGAGIPCRMPDWFSEPPKPLVVIDTSGSMDSEDLGLALGVVKDVLKLCQSSLVISGDTDLKTAKTVFTVSSIPLQGGGGTDMGAIMEAAEKTYLRKGYGPCIVVTDGYTPWPSSRLKGKWIALVTQDTDVPSWITRVPIR